MRNEDEGGYRSAPCEGVVNKAVIVSTAVRQHLLFFLQMGHNSVAAGRQKHSSSGIFTSGLSDCFSLVFLLLSFWLARLFSQLNVRNTAGSSVDFC